MKPGRKPYTSELLVQRGLIPENWKDIIINLGKEGKNKMYFANALGLHRDTFYKIMKRDPEFNKIVQQALQYSQIWWIENVREAFEQGTSSRLNSNLFKYYMQNVYRDDWKDETQLDITSKGDKIKDDNTIQIEIIRPKEEDDDES